MVETGDDISDCIDSECLLLVNHQSTGDVPVIMQALTDANKRQLSRHVCWILDDMFKYANFGLPCHVHGDFFILQVNFYSHLSVCRLLWDLPRRPHQVLHPIHLFDCLSVHLGPLIFWKQESSSNFKFSGNIQT